LSLYHELKRRNVFRVGAAYVVVAWLLIQVAETIFPLFGFDDTPARIVVVVLAIGFIPSMILAWVFELTPEGLKKDKDVDRARSIALDTGKKLDRVIMVVLVLALGYFGFDKFLLSPQREADLIESATQAGALMERVRTSAISNNSVAVLPFVNMSTDPDQEYFSDGLSEEILTLLAKTPDLTVIGRTSSFAFKGKNEDLRVIGETLGVKTVLEGSVRKSGDQVRITAQLIDVSDGSNIWSESYDRTMTDIFALQDDVASAIIEALQIHVSTMPTRGRPTQNVEAYILFLKAKEALNAFEMVKSETLLIKATELDPNFAEAFELLAYYYALAAGGVIDTIEAQRRSGEAAARAIAIDPDLVFAQALYRLANMGVYSFADIIVAFERTALLQSDDPQVADLLIFLLSDFGYLQDALPLAERYVQVDPLSLVANLHYAQILYGVGRTNEAIAALEFVNWEDLVPDAYMWTIEGLNLAEGRDEATITHLESWLQRNDYHDSGWVRDLLTGGRDPDTGQAYLDRRIPQIVASMPENDPFAWQTWLPSLYLYFGHLDRFFELALAGELSTTTWDVADIRMSQCNIYRRLGCTAHPKYLELAKSLGIIDIWEERGPPDFCERQDGLWVCK
jgi:TolB-like protein/tetratricopeptide (TPR) repeat protein